MKRFCRAFLIVAAQILVAAVGFAQEPAIRHRVQAGDTVPRLSWQYKVRADAIRAANGLKGDVLTPGTTILIPSGGGPASPPSTAEPDTIRIAPRATPLPVNPIARETRETTGPRDMHDPAKKPPAVADRPPRAEAEAMPTPYVQDLGARSPRGEVRPRNVAPPKATENAPRDEPPLDELNGPAAAPRKPAELPEAMAPPRP